MLKYISFILLASMFLGLIFNQVLGPLPPLYFVLGVLFLCGLLMMLAFILKKDWGIQKNRLETLQALKNRNTEIEGLLETAIDRASIGIILFKIDGKLIKFNAAASELFKSYQGKFTNTNYYELMQCENAEKLKNEFQHLIDHKIKFYHEEQKIHQGKDVEIWITSDVFVVPKSNHNDALLFAEIKNISELKKIENQLQQASFFDALTMLPNRRSLTEFLDRTLEVAKRYQQEFALLFLDIDHFKNINDTFGHEAGDVLLQEIASRLKKAMRGTDFVARLGGDEFAIVLTNIEKTETAAQVALKILEGLLQEYNIKENSLYITGSIGISYYPHDGSTIAMLMKNADLAAHKAKELGRNNYQFYTEEMTVHAQRKLKLQNALAQALHNNEFVLHYQPKMEVATRRIIGVEALLRWKNTEFEVITPQEIINLAEDTGLIIPVTEWILKTACKELKSWHELGFSSLRLAINLTARFIKNPMLIENMNKILQDNELEFSSLEVEVKEKALMRDSEAMLPLLRNIKHAGANIVIDDFGAGYWSLANMRHVEIDKIKIDKSFIKDITQNEVSQAIVSAIIAMGKKLNIIVVGEGVENKQQYDLLVEDGCQEIQGYYLTQPLTAELLINFLKHPIPHGEMIR